MVSAAGGESGELRVVSDFVKRSRRAAEEICLRQISIIKFAFGEFIPQLSAHEVRRDHSHDFAEGKVMSALHSLGSPREPRPLCLKGVSVKNKFFTLGFVAFAALQQRFCFAKPAPIPTERKLSLRESYGIFIC